jgi:hypothetical protein
MKPTFTLIILAALPLLAQAQQVWRCGADGRSYSSVPCVEGRQLEVPEARPAADLAAARAQATREVRLADTMHKQRLAEESAQRGSGITGIGPLAQFKPALPSPAKSRLKKRRSAAEATDTWPEAAVSSRRKKG